MAPKFPQPDLDHPKPFDKKSWKPAGSDPAVDEDHEIPTEEPKRPMPTPMPAD